MAAEMRRPGSKQHTEAVVSPDIAAGLLQILRHGSAGKGTVIEASPTLLSETCEAVAEAEAGSSGPLSCGVEALREGDSGRLLWASTWVEAPPQDASNVDLAVCIDVSGSMANVLQHAKPLLSRLVDRLKLDDQLCVVAFCQDASVIADWTAGTSVGKEELHRKIDDLKAAGGTAFLPALDLVLAKAKAAAEAAANGNSMRQTYVLFVSDGASEEANSKVCKHLEEGMRHLDACLAAVALGTGSDAGLMSQLSRIGRGPFVFVNSREAISRAVGQIWKWAEASSMCCFLVVRGLEECRVIDVEGPFGQVELKPGVVRAAALGPLLLGQRRVLAMRLEVPIHIAERLQGRLHADLVKCTYILKCHHGYRASSCTLHAGHVFSLDSKPGFPLRVTINEDVTEFGDKEQSKLEREIGRSLHLPAGAVVTSSVRSLPTSPAGASSKKAGDISPRCIQIDAHVAMPKEEAVTILEDDESPDRVLEELHSHGLGKVSSVEVPGRETARRWLQRVASQAISKEVDATADDMDSISKATANHDAVTFAKELASGPLGDLSSSAAGAVLDTIEEHLPGKQSNTAGAEHRRLEAVASHNRAFPLASVPEGATPASDLGSYTTPELRRGALELQTPTVLEVESTKAREAIAEARENHDVSKLAKGIEQAQAVGVPEEEVEEAVTELEHMREERNEADNRLATALHGVSSWRDLPVLEAALQEAKETDVRRYLVQKGEEKMAELQMQRDAHFAEVEKAMETITSRNGSEAIAAARAEAAGDPSKLLALAEHFGAEHTLLTEAVGSATTTGLADEKLEASRRTLQGLTEARLATEAEAENTRARLDAEAQLQSFVRRCSGQALETQQEQVRLSRNPNEILSLAEKFGADSQHLTTLMDNATAAGTAPTMIEATQQAVRGLDMARQLAEAEAARRRRQLEAEFDLKTVIKKFDRDKLCKAIERAEAATVEASCVEEAKARLENLGATESALSSCDKIRKLKHAVRGVDEPLRASMFIKQEVEKIKDGTKSEEDGSDDVLQARLSEQSAKLDEALNGIQELDSKVDLSEASRAAVGDVVRLGRNAAHSEEVFGDYMETVHQCTKALRAEHKNALLQSEQLKQHASERWGVPVEKSGKAQRHGKSETAIPPPVSPLSEGNSMQVSTSEWRAASKRAGRIAAEGMEITGKAISKSDSVPVLPEIVSPGRFGTNHTRSFQVLQPQRVSDYSSKLPALRGARRPTSRFR